MEFSEKEHALIYDGKSPQGSILNVESRGWETEGIRLADLRRETKMRIEETLEHCEVHLRYSLHVSVFFKDVTSNTPYEPRAGPGRAWSHRRGLCVESQSMAMWVCDRPRGDVKCQLFSLPPASPQCSITATLNERSWF